MAEAKQQYKPMHPIMRSMQKQNARKMLAKTPPAPDPVADAVADVKKNLESVLTTKKMTPEQRQAIAAGAARAWYADFPGAATDIAGMILDYGVEGLKSIMPGPELTGYNLEKDLKVDELQKGLKDPFLGYKHLEKVGEEVGYIPPATGTDEEFNARMLAGLVDPTPLPLTAGVFASNRAKNLPKLSKAKAEKMEAANSKPQEIFEDTGFFRGPEGEWRFEISDKDMKVNQEFLKTKTELWGKEVSRGPGYDQGETYGKLSDAIDHPELFKAYPELEDVYLKFIPPGSDIRGMSGLRGSYNEDGVMVPTAPGSGAALTSDDVPTDLYGEPLQTLEQSNKTPEAYRKVIMVVAPTRQKSIQNLQFIVDEASTTLKGDFARLRSFESNPQISKDELGYHTTMREYKNNINRTQEKIKENLPELERLKAGGQPDLNFSVKSTLTHEIQHAIQGIEDLPRGGNAYTAYRETEDAVLSPLKAKAKENFPNQGEYGLPEQKRLYDEKLRDMSMMDDVQYLQQLQKFINSDKPTRNARYIESSSYGYEVSNDYDMRTWLGPRPKKRKTKEYAEYLRKKALLYQHIVINKYVAGKPLKRSADMTQIVSQNRSYRFGELIADLVGYTEVKGTATHSKAIGDQFKQGYINNFGEPADWEKLKGIPGINRVKDTPFDPNKIFNDDPSNIARRWDVVNYDQPDWLSLGEKNVKNYVKRLARSADKHAEAAGMQREIENKLKVLQARRQKWESEGKQGDHEFYKRLAGEAEARAVQKRLELADIEAGGSGRYDPNTTDPGEQEIRDFRIGRMRDEIGKVPTDIYDVPLNELAFTGRTSAAKNQAKTDARTLYLRN